METIFVEKYSELPVMLEMIGDPEKNLSVIIADKLWDEFLYRVAGPLLPMDRLAAAQENGTCFFEYVDFFTNSKWVKGNPPENSNIEKALSKIREGIKRFENIEMKEPGVLMVKFPGEENYHPL